MPTKTSLFVKLISSDNPYITYPSYGLLDIHEFGTNGSIIGAVFRVMTDEKLGAAVQVKNAQFEYAREIVSKGHAAVIDLHERERDSSPDRNYEHILKDQGSGEILGVFKNRMACESFCSHQRLQVESYNTTNTSEVVKAYAYSSLVSDTLAKIYDVIASHPDASDIELEAMVQGLGINARQARSQVQIYKSSAKF